jgi:S1-C subfamily serine protease
MDLGPMEEMYRRYFPGEPEDGTPFSPAGSGTGFVVSADGYILTNHHVIVRADAIHVRFSGESGSVAAELVGSDPASDLAVIRIARDGLEPLVFADSDRVRVGDWAIVVGNPFGNLEGSLTVGVISAKGRSDLAIHGGAPRFQDFIQTDAPINFGNSGGPLLDLLGRVIGINTAINSSGQGIGFAVPANQARRVCEQIMEHGRVIRGWVGLRCVDHLVDGMPGGALVDAVLPDSPAAAAGVAPGDVVTALGGHAVRNDRELQFLVADAEPGVGTTLSLLREGRATSLAVVPGTAPEREPDAEPSVRHWHGLIAAPAAGDDPRVAHLREALGVAAEHGLMVVAVVPDSPAERAGLHPGDVILEIDDRPVDDLVQYRQLQEELAGTDLEITLLVEAGGTRGYRLLDPHGTSRGS